MTRLSEQILSLTKQHQESQQALHMMSQESDLHTQELVKQLWDQFMNKILFTKFVYIPQKISGFSLFFSSSTKWLDCGNKKCFMETWNVIYRSESRENESSLREEISQKQAIISEHDQFKNQIQLVRNMYKLFVLAKL